MSKKPPMLSKDLRNPLGLDPGTLSTLTDVFSLLREVNLATKTVRYIADGEEPATVLELAGEPKAADAMGMGKTNSRSAVNKSTAAAKSRSRFFDAVQKSPHPEFLQRLGEVLFALRGNQPGLRTFFSEFPDWLVALLIEIILVHRMSPLRAWPLSLLQPVLQRGNVDAGRLAELSFHPAFDEQVRATLGWAMVNWTTAFSGWSDLYLHHPDRVREGLQQTTAEGRLQALIALETSLCPLAAFAAPLVALSADSSKQVRDQVLKLLLTRTKDDSTACTAIRHECERVLQTGDAGARNEAAVLLWRVCGPDTKTLLQQHAETESAPRVKQTIERLLNSPDAGDGEKSFERIVSELPPVAVPVGEIPLPDAARHDLRTQLLRCYEDEQRQYTADIARYEAADAQNRHHKPQQPAAINESELTALFAFVEGRTKKIPAVEFKRYFWKLTLPDSWSPPEVQLIHLLRLLHAVSLLNLNRTLWMPKQEMLEAYRARCRPPFGLRELDATAATIPQFSPGVIAASYLASNTAYHSQFDWEPEAIWPVFAEQRQILLSALGPSPNRGRDYNSYDYSFTDKRRNAFKVLAMFPCLPGDYVAPLWDMALGDSKSDRLPAQRALASVEGKTDKILLALQDGRQDTRAAAAEWLGRIKDPAAIEPLKTAFRKEKQEYAKGTYMSALEALGANVEEFLDRGKLLKEAEAGLAKKRPKGLEWFPYSSMPVVRWGDTSQPVDPLILEWWVVQTVQQKSPACGPLLRRYLQMCHPADVEAFGKFVLASWIAQDSRHPSPEEAAERAKKDADQQFTQWGQQSWFIDVYKDKDGLYRQLLQNYSEQFLGSAVAEKGMLALASAVGDADCVKLCEQYIRKYFGNKLAQCKALIEVLAWMNHPLAIQVLLSIANRFRTKALRQAADEHVHALAEREGWTIDELADRTIPDAGFVRATDEDGRPTGTVAELKLDYGPRSFVVTLDDNLEPVITREDGKAVKAPPAPAKTDDAELAKAAKKTFSDAKKLVKDVVRRQAERLYEAVCTQRSWKFADWQRDLAQHPIVGKICTRLVWSAFEPDPEAGQDRYLTNFRPLEDGSLTNEQDETVSLEPNTIIRVAHDCNTPEEARTLWSQHLQDYEVDSLFQQFGRTVFELPAARGDETEIKDFQGYLLTTFKLRGKANKLGWLRGEAEDGGCYYLYRKPFPSLELQAVLEFTGSFLPESDIPAALKGLSFEAIKNNHEQTNTWGRSHMPLKKVPPVLLSECYNDVSQIAGEGTGFDPQWETKSYF